MVIGEIPGFTSKDKALNQLEQKILSGKHWYLALLETIASCVDEDSLIDGEALNLLGLARDIAPMTRGMVPDREIEDFLQGKLPLELTGEELSEIIGEKKYSLYLNFFYGVVVESALINLTREELSREGFLLPVYGTEEEAYLRIYGLSMRDMSDLFTKKHGRQPSREELTYFAFKHRLAHAEKEKLASDTKRALLWLERQGQSTSLYCLSL